MAPTHSRNSAIVSAPGKILWIGGYSVLERPNEAFVTGVDKRVYGHAQEIEEGKIILEAPQFNALAEGKIEASGKIVFKENTPPETIASLKFVKNAVETCCRYLSFKNFGGKSQAAFKGIHLTTLSDPAFGFTGSKSGLGSSAAATVAAVGAVLELNNKSISKTENIQLLHKIAQYSHSLSQGKVGSGFDVAASCFGGCKYVRYSPSFVPLENLTDQQLAHTIDSPWDCITEKLDLPHGLEIAMASFAGESASTSQMVKQVNEFKKQSPKEYGELMQKINQANTQAISALSSINAKYHQNSSDYFHILLDLENNRNSDYHFKKFYEAFKEGRFLTKKLGVLSGAAIETDECSALVEESEQHGAFAAKLPGAGGGDAIAAICIGSKQKALLEEFWKNYSKKSLQVLRVKASNAGGRKENEMPLFHLKA